LTLADALRVLGLEPGADPKTVRRAYLKLIKQHKPEQDPAGFQRLRDAYEIARAGGIFETMVIARTRRDPAPAASTEPAAQADGLEAGDAFERFAGAWSRLAPSADRSEYMRVAREAMAALPDDPRAHWLLASALSRSDSEEPLADVLRAAWRKGWPEFLEALLIRVPDRTKRDEVEAAFASESATLRLAAAAVAARWASRRAAQVVIDLCRTAADTTLEAKAHRMGALPIPEMLDVILALHAAGAIETAADAQAALRSYLNDSGRELRLLETPIGRVWTMAEEIDALPRGFPPLLREAFARGTRSGDLTYAFWESRIAIAHDRLAVERWVAHLAGSARNVTDTMRAALAYVPPPVAPPSFRAQLRSFLYCTVLMAGLVAIIIAMVRLFPTNLPHP